MKKTSMSKKIISLLLICSMMLGVCPVAWAVEKNEVGAIAGTDEEIVVSLEESQAILSILREIENSECGVSSHIAPSGYRYVGCTKGNSVVDAMVTEAGGMIMAHIPGLGTIYALISASLALDTFLNWMDEGRIRTTYYKYTWRNGGKEWTHVVWVYNDKGQDKYLACEVVTE